LRIDNLHYDLTEEDLEVNILFFFKSKSETKAMQGLFSGIGPVARVRIDYDRAGRSEGVATVTYQYLEDARKAIRDFDGANAKGQPIRLTLLPPGRGPKAEKSKSLFDRIERPRDRTERSLSPDEEGSNTTGGRRRRGGRGGRGRGEAGAAAGGRRSDVSKPAPEHIDRYVPGQGQQRNTGRRPGDRRDEKRREGGGGGRQNGTRPRKTQEELDQEMDDYWGTTNTATTGAAETVVTAPATTTEPAAPAPAANDDDIDMIE
jgi:THO complex subunit 4